MSFIEKWVDSLTEEQAKEELKRLHVKYDERAASMRDAGDIVRSLFAGSEVSKRILDLRQQLEEAKAEIERLKGVK